MSDEKASELPIEKLSAEKMSAETDEKSTEPDLEKYGLLDERDGFLKIIIFRILMYGHY